LSDDFWDEAEVVFPEVDIRVKRVFRTYHVKSKKKKYMLSFNRNNNLFLKACYT
jgi:hypothetical protein